MATAVLHSQQAYGTKAMKVWQHQVSSCICTGKSGRLQVCVCTPKTKMRKRRKVLERTLECSLQRGKTSLPLNKVHGPVLCIVVGCCEKLAAALDSATMIILFRPGFCWPPSMYLRSSLSRTPVLCTVVTKWCFVYTPELNKGMTYIKKMMPRTFACLNGVKGYLCLCD